MSFSFIDLFAGIGGFRIPLQQLGGTCVFSSEYNTAAQQTYYKNFGEIPSGDITQLDLSTIPKHDILTAGFPCQSFSISGKMKGFDDARGTLIWYVFKIIEIHQPKVIFLENVKHLIHHDGGKSFESIITALENLGYKISYNILNASDFGIPQNRERIIIIGHKEKLFDFEKIKIYPRVTIKSILEDISNGHFVLNEHYTLIDNPTTQDSGLMFVGYLNKKTRTVGVRKGTEHLSRAHKQPNRIYSSDGIHPTLSSQESSGRFWIHVNGKVRKLTVAECYRLMGFPDTFKKADSVTEQYRQIGNSVCIPMVREIGKQILEQLM